MEKDSGLPALKKTRSVGQRSKEEMFQVVKGVVENHQEGGRAFCGEGDGISEQKTWCYKMGRYYPLSDEQQVYP